LGRYAKIPQSAVEKAGLAEFDALLRAEARPCFRIGRIIGDFYAEVGNSRFGGQPDLPAGFEWPLDDGAAMTFLAQINLAELAGGFVPDLPGRGWLYFFLGRDEQWQAMPHQIYYFAGPQAELQRRRPPPEIPPVAAFCPRAFTPNKVVFVPEYSIRYGASVWEQTGLPPFSAELIRKRDIFFQESTQLGGYELTFNGEPARDAYRHRHDLVEPRYARLETDEHIIAAMKNAQEHGDAAALARWQGELELFNQSRAWLRKHSPGIAAWQPLLTLESLHTAGMMWVDVGFLQFMIQRDDLLARNFHHTYCELMST
jgi:uncharacterized protein YwqG